MTTTKTLKINDILAISAESAPRRVYESPSGTTLAQTPKADLIMDDALHALADVPSNSVDGGVIDPPYGKRVRGIRWDLILPNYPIWVELLRVLKPGAHVAVFCFPDMAHKLVMDLGKAGFEVRTVWIWHYPNGLPAVQP